MKKVLLLAGGCVLALAACKEKAPPIDFSDPKAAVDTSYIISPVPAKDPHNVLAEEFTGQTCPNCPAAHDQLKSLAAAGRLNTIGLYVYGLTQTKPVTGSANDFRDSTATHISDDIYLGGPKSGIPCAGIDRVPVSGTLQLYSSAWADAYNQRLTVQDSLNLSVSSSYDATDSTATITAYVTYTEQVSTKQNLTIAIVEDNIIDKQEIPTGVEENYAFTNVFRAMVTAAPYGDPVMPALVVKEKGRQNKRVYSYKMNPRWNPSNCRVIAFVSYSSSEGRKDVIQSVQAKLAP